MTLPVIARRLLVLAALSGAYLVVSASDASAATIVVNVAHDDDVNAPDDGDCTLSEALWAANTDLPQDQCIAGGASDTISFNIPGSDHTIEVADTHFPNVAGGVTVDGTTDPDVARIELDGSATSAGHDGLQIVGDNATIRGMVIHSFARSGIRIGNAVDGTTVRNNYIGTNAAGTLGQGNDFAGIELLSAQFDNRIGGAGPGQGNVISGNGDAGIRVTSTPGVFIEGNHIGTDADGDDAVPNGTEGVRIQDSTNAGILSGNVISGNVGIGVRFLGGSTGGTNSAVTGSNIGHGATGTALGNGGAGISIEGATTGVLIGTDIDGNRIGHNGGDGVQVLAGTGHAIVGNSFESNSGLGIDLGATGVDENDPDDLDNGPNNFQNFPDLDAAVVQPDGSVEISGSLDSTPSTQFTVHAFGSSGCDGSGHGEGETVIGGDSVTTDGDGDAAFSFSTPAGTASGSDFIVTSTATLLDPSLGEPVETSEFSACIQAESEPIEVNSVNDPGDGTCDSTECTLREAIVMANGSSGLDTVIFDISGAGPHTIVVSRSAGPLPAITDSISIDGASEPSYSAPGPPVIEIDGTALAADPPIVNGKGLWLSAGSAGSTISALTINDFPEEGILILSDDNKVLGSQLGTDDTGLLAEGNFEGIRIGGGTGNVIGGTTPATRNIIGGNDFQGIEIQSDPNTALGNYVGVGRNGTADVGNGTDGVAVTFSSSPGAPGNLIGGTAAGAGNLIAGNGDAGISVFDSDATSIQGNTIGLDSSGADRGNDGDGIEVSDAAGTMVGGTTAGSMNVISGNSGHGVALAAPNTSGTLIAGNRIGTDPTGVNGRPNDNDGINLSTTGSGSPQVANTTIGGTAAGAGNLISGNTDDGIYIEGRRTAGVTIQGNLIGLTADGETLLGNGSDGVEAIDPEGAFLLGGSGGRNFISGNGGYGAHLRGFITTYQVKGNFIGTDDDGTTARPNSIGGVLVQGVNSIVGGSLETTPGGACTGECNLISGNFGIGLSLSSLATTGNNSVVQGNYVGTSASGIADLGNDNWGVRIGAADVLVGGASPSARNVISGNATDGLALEDATVTNVVVQGNYVGVGTDGTTPLENSGSGIRVRGHDNTIGGTTAGTGNTVAHNFLSGILVFGAAADGNAILGNSIFENGSLGIDLDNPSSVEPNDTGDVDAGANQTQNFPELDEVVTGASASLVAGTLQSAPSETYRIELFSSPACDEETPSPGTHGEGQTLIDAFNTTTNGSGTASFSFTIPPVATGSVVTATATDSDDNTSEFSECETVVANAPPTGVSIGSLPDFSVQGSFPVTWSGSDPHGPLNYKVEVQQAQFNSGFGGFTTIADGSSTQATFQATPGRTYCFRVTATDNLGDFTTSPEECTARPVDDTSFARKKFKAASMPGAYLDTAAVGKKKKASLTLNDVRADQLMLIISRCPKCGVLKISFAGVSMKVKTKGPLQRQVMVPIADFATAQTGTVKITKPKKKGMVIVEGLGVSAV